MLKKLVGVPVSILMFATMFVLVSGVSSFAQPPWLDSSCEFIDVGEPEGWKAADYDDSSWTATTVHSANDVRPKDGYHHISWDPRAELIWGPDLETDNTILCRSRSKRRNQRTSQNTK